MKHFAGSRIAAGIVLAAGLGLSAAALEGCGNNTGGTPANGVSTDAGTTPGTDGGAAGDAAVTPGDAEAGTDAGAGADAGPLAMVDPAFSDGGVMFFTLTTGGSAEVKCLSASGTNGIEVGGNVYPEGIGSSGFVARVTSAGVLDPTFVPDQPTTPAAGVVETQLLYTACARQADGRFVGARNTGATKELLRVSNTGSLDATLVPGKLPFAPVALGITGGSDLLLAHDGTMGIEALVASTAGSLGAPATLPTTSDLNVIAARSTPTGKVLLAGRAPSGIFVARLDGTALDPAFGTGGLARVSTTQNSAHVAFAAGTDGSVVAVTGPGLRVARLLPDGTPDAAFGTKGVTLLALDGEPSDLALDAQGRPLLTLIHTNKSIALVRLDVHGAPDPAFAPSGVLEMAQFGTPPSTDTFVPRQALLSFQDDGLLVVAASGPSPTPRFTLVRVVP